MQQVEEKVVFHVSQSRSFRFSRQFVREMSNEFEWMVFFPILFLSWEFCKSVVSLKLASRFWSYFRMNGHLFYNIHHRNDRNYCDRSLITSDSQKLPSFSLCISRSDGQTAFMWLNEWSAVFVWGEHIFQGRIVKKLKWWVIKKSGKVREFNSKFSTSK